MLISMPVKNTILTLDLPDDLDIAAHYRRLTHEMEQNKARISKYDALLESEEFLANAPSEVIGETISKLGEAIDRQFSILEIQIQMLRNAV